MLRDLPKRIYLGVNMERAEPLSGAPGGAPREKRLNQLLNPRAKA